MHGQIERPAGLAIVVELGQGIECVQRGHQPAFLVGRVSRVDEGPARLLKGQEGLQRARSASGRTDLGRVQPGGDQPGDGQRG